MKKYKWFGPNGHSLKLFESYLSDQRQCVVANGIASEETEMKLGTPQGSCLATFNLLGYVNDLGKLPMKGKIRALADDKVVEISRRVF